MIGVKAKRTKTAVSEDALRRPKGEELRLSSEDSGIAKKYIRMGRVPGYL